MSDTLEYGMKESTRVLVIGSFLLSQLELSIYGAW